MPLEGTASGPIASRVTPGSTRPAPILTSRSQTSQSPCSQVTSESKPVSFAYPTTGRRIPVRPAAGLTELARHEQVAYTVPSRRSPKRTSVSLMTSMVMAQQMSEKVATPSQAKTEGRSTRGRRGCGRRRRRTGPPRAGRRARSSCPAEPLARGDDLARPRPAVPVQPPDHRPPPPSPAPGSSSPRRDDARGPQQCGGPVGAAGRASCDRCGSWSLRFVVWLVRARCAFVPRSSRVRSSLPLRVPASRLRRHPGHVRGGKAWMRCERMRGVGTGVRGGAVRSTW